MGETLDLTVLQARAVLANTRGMGSEQVDEAQKVMDKFHASRPRRACVACGCMIFSEHSADGDAVWACDRCHRGADLTADQWHAQQDAERAAADAHLKALDAAAPPPRQALAEALARLETAKQALATTEAAQPAARSTLAAATLKHERAEAEAAEVDARVASHLADSFLGGRTTGPAPSPAAARAALATAADGLAAARAAKALLDEQLSDRRTAVATAQAFARKAAIAVIAADRLDDLLTEATAARAAYLESVGAIGWLIQHGAIPSTDARPRQIVTGANVPPSAWPEARTAGTEAMETALAALL